MKKKKRDGSFFKNNVGNLWTQNWEKSLEEHSGRIMKESSVIFMEKARIQKEMLEKFAKNCERILGRISDQDLRIVPRRIPEVIKKNKKILCKSSEKNQRNIFLSITSNARKNGKRTLRKNSFKKKLGKILERIPGCFPEAVP